MEEKAIKIQRMEILLPCRGTASNNISATLSIFKCFSSGISVC
jgi:hypothetical protein